MKLAPPTVPSTPTTPVDSASSPLPMSSTPSTSRARVTGCIPSARPHRSVETAPLRRSDRRCPLVAPAARPRSAEQRRFAARKLPRSEARGLPSPRHTVRTANSPLKPCDRLCRRRGATILGDRRVTFRARSVPTTVPRAGSIHEVTEIGLGGFSGRERRPGRLGGV